MLGTGSLPLKALLSFFPSLVPQKEGEWGQWVLLSALHCIDLLLWPLCLPPCLQHSELGEAQACLRPLQLQGPPHCQASFFSETNRKLSKGLISPRASRPWSNLDGLENPPPSMSGMREELHLSLHSYIQPLLHLCSSLCGASPACQVLSLPS